MRKNNWIRKMLASIMAVSVLVGVQPEIGSFYEGRVIKTVKAATELKGKGTEKEPYEISTADEFVNMIKALPGTSLAKVDTVYYKQTQDIKLDEYSGVGSDKMFHGVYDGQGYSITAEISVENSDNGVSIFPYLYGTIYNLGIKGSIRITKGGDVPVGGICRSVRDGGRIINCWCNSRLKSTGGEVGAIAASTEAKGIIQNCYYKGKLNAKENFGITRAKNGAKVTDAYYWLESESSDVSKSTGTGNTYKASGEKAVSFDVNQFNKAVESAQKTYTEYTLCKYQRCYEGDFVFEKIKTVPSETATQNATTAPTQNATTVPTQNATIAPTQNTTTAPTQNATATPTPKASATPTPKATVTPTPKNSATPNPTVASATPKVSLNPTIAPSLIATQIPTATQVPNPVSTPEIANTSKPATASAVTPDVIVDGEVLPNGEVFVANDIRNAKVTMEQKYSYTGYSVGAEYSVEMNGKKLEEGQDFTISYENNIDVGTASLVITGIGMYTGVKKEPFSIVKSITMLQITNISSKNYTGKPIVPKVVIADGKYVLKLDVDYKITVENNINLGKAKVKLEGIGNYDGTITKTFTIKKATLKSAKISIVKAVIKKRKSKISFKVKIGKVTLKNKVDYTLTYKINKKKTRVTVVVKAKKRYTGTKKIVLKI